MFTKIDNDDENNNIQYKNVSTNQISDNFFNTLLLILLSTNINCN